MSIARVMVAVDLGDDCRARVELAASIAKRFNAGMTGIAARDLQLAEMGDAAAFPLLVKHEEERAGAELRDAEAIFRNAMHNDAGIVWHGLIARPDAYIAEQARTADLLVVGSVGEDSDSGRPLAIDPANIVMTAGRPVLVTPPGARYLSARRIVVAWKDSREARRAVRDALPFLKRAELVRVVGIREPGSHLAVRDVVQYLEAHKVVAEPLVRDVVSGTVAEALQGIAVDDDADLIVAGAYGHSRLREWIFGGVTAELLTSSPVCCLLSH